MTTTHFARPIFSLGLVLLLAGCGENHESKLIGSWKARPMSAVLNGIKGNANGASTQEAVDEAKIMAAATLDIRADKTFTLNLSGTTKGTWTWSDDTETLSLMTTKFGGQSIAPPPGASASEPNFKAKFNSDDSMITLSNSMSANDGGIELNFEKS